MRLLFITYKEPGILQLSLQDHNKDALHLLFKALLTRQAFLDVRILKPNFNENIITIENCPPKDIENFLLETKKCFIDSGVSEENWNEFLDTVENFFRNTIKSNDLDLSLLNSSVNEFKNLPKNFKKLPTVILSESINSFLSFKDQAAFKRTHRDIYENTDNYKFLLKKYFPDDYDNFQAFFKEQKDKEFYEDLKIDLQDKNLYKEAYRKAFERNYKGLNKEQIQLMTFFKDGDLHSIQVFFTKKNVNSYLWNQTYTINDVQDADDRNLLYWANRNNHRQVLDYCFTHLSEKGAPSTSPLLAIYAWQTLTTIDDIINETKSNNASWTSRYGYTLNAISLAARIGRLDVIQHLISKQGVDFSYDQGGREALREAIRFHHFDIVKYFIEKGVNLNVPHNKKTPLEIATEEHDLEMIKLFVEALKSDDGSNHYDINQQVFDALLISIKLKDFNIFKYLISLDSINLKQVISKTKPSLVSTACFENNLEVLRYLAALPDIDLIERNLRRNTYGGSSLYDTLIKDNQFDIRTTICLYLISTQQYISEYLANKDIKNTLHRSEFFTYTDGSRGYGKVVDNVWKWYENKNPEYILHPLKDYLSNIFKNHSSEKCKESDFVYILFSNMLIEKSKESPESLANAIKFLLNQIDTHKYFKNPNKQAIQFKDLLVQLLPKVEKQIAPPEIEMKTYRPKLKS